MFKNIKYAYNGIARRFIFTILAIIQFTLAFTFLYFIIQQNSSIANEVDRITAIIGGRNLYGTHMTDDAAVFSNKEKFDASMELNKYIDNNPLIKKVVFSNEWINVKNFDGVNKFAGTGALGEKYSWLDCANIDESFADNFKFEVKAGRYFIKDDFKKGINDEIPVVLGSYFSNYFKINDEIEYINNKNGDRNTNRKMKIVGFLKENYYFFFGGNSNYMNRNLDRLILFPLHSINDTVDAGNEEGVKEVSTLYNLVQLRDSLLIIDVKDKAEKDKVIKAISDKRDELKLTELIKFVDISNKGNSLANNFQSSLKEHSILVWLILAFSSIGIICTTLNNIEKRYKEFGVHIIYGARLRDIAKRIYYEIAIVLVTSLIISFIFSNIISKYLKLVEDNDLVSIITSGKLVFFVLVLSVIISIYPIYKVIKIKPVHLIRR